MGKLSFKDKVKNLLFYIKGDINLDESILDEVKEFSNVISEIQRLYQLGEKMDRKGKGKGIGKVQKYVDYVVEEHKKNKEKAYGIIFYLMDIIPSDMSDSAYYRFRKGLKENFIDLKDYKQWQIRKLTTEQQKQDFLKDFQLEIEI